MGQNNSKQSNETALSPIQLRAKEIATIVRTTAPAATLHDPLPAIPHDAQHEEHEEEREVLWDAVLRAEGFDNLRQQAERFLATWTPHDLLVLIAEQNNEEESETRERFALRYLGVTEPEDVDMWGWEGVYGFARMLHDELDLPGFRFGTALRRWRKIVGRVGKLHQLDQEGADMTRNSILALIHDHGFTRLVDCIQEDHAKELGVQNALSAIKKVDPQTGEKVLLEPDFWYGFMNHAVVAANVRDWLFGESQLSLPPSKGGYPRRWRAWAQWLDVDTIPANADLSIESIMHAAHSEASITHWKEGYTRALRHIDLFDIESLVEQVLEGLSPSRRNFWMNHNVEAILAKGRRPRPTERLAAVVADELAAERRREREASETSQNEDSPPLQRRPGAQTDRRTTPVLPEEDDTQGLDDDSPTPHTGIRRTPSLDLGLEQESEQEDSEDELYRVTPPLKTKPLSKPKTRGDPSTSESMYNDLLEENTDLLVTQGELEAMITNLMEELAEAQQQLDEEAQLQKPRPRPICGIHLLDEEAERLHMAKHRDELNKCIEKNGLKSYGIDAVSFAEKQRGRKPRFKSPQERRSNSSNSQSRERERERESQESPQDEYPPIRKEPMFGDLSSSEEATGLGIDFGSSSQPDDFEKEHFTPPTSPDPLVTYTPPPRPRSTSRGSSKRSSSRKESPSLRGSPATRSTRQRVLKAVVIPVEAPVVDEDSELSNIVVQSRATPKRGLKRKGPSALEEFLDTRGQSPKRRKR